MNESVEDRYFNHIIGCLDSAHERAKNGWVMVTDDLVCRAKYLLKEQQAEIERLKGTAKNGNGFIEQCDSRTAQMFSH